jgi:hypothetical protein
LKWSTVWSTFSRSEWSVVRSALLLKGVCWKKVPTQSKEVSPQTLQTALYVLPFAVHIWAPRRKFVAWLELCPDHSFMRKGIVFILYCWNEQKWDGRTIMNKTNYVNGTHHAKLLMREEWYMR